MKRFGVHVFVENCELREVNQLAILRLALQPLPHALQDLRLVGKCRLEAGQRQVPARAVRDLRRVVERVAAAHETVGDDAFAAAPQAPILLEPGDVPQLPQRWVDDGELRPQQPAAIEAGGDARKMIAAGAQFGGKCGGIHCAAAAFT